MRIGCQAIPKMSSAKASGVDAAMKDAQAGFKVRLLLKINH